MTMTKAQFCERGVTGETIGTRLGLGGGFPNMSQPIVLM
jgi:hypothetical protein